MSYRSTIERISSQQKLLGRLGSQLQGLRNEIKQTQNQLSSGERTLETSRSRYLGSVRRLYLTLPRRTENLVESPQNELEKKRQVTYLGAIVASASGDVSEAEEYLDAARSGLEQLSGKQSKVERLKQQRQVSYALDQSRKQKRQRQLDKLRRMKKEEFDKIVVLQQSAEEMGQILESPAGGGKVGIVASSSSGQSTRGIIVRRLQGEFAESGKRGSYCAVRKRHSSGHAPEVLLTRNSDSGRSRMRPSVRWVTVRWPIPAIFAATAIS